MPRSGGQHFPWKEVVTPVCRSWPERELAAKAWIISAAVEPKHSPDHQCQSADLLDQPLQPPPFFTLVLQLSHGRLEGGRDRSKPMAGPLMPGWGRAAGTDRELQFPCSTHQP